MAQLAGLPPRAAATVLVAQLRAPLPSPVLLPLLLLPLRLPLRVLLLLLPLMKLLLLLHPALPCVLLACRVHLRAGDR